MNDVWLNTNMRHLFKALGFQETGNGLVQLAKPSQDTISAILRVLEDLAIGHTQLMAQVRDIRSQCSTMSDANDSTVAKSHVHSESMQYSTAPAV